MNNLEPIAWMRSESSVSPRVTSGGEVAPFRYKNHEITRTRLRDDDVALYSEKSVTQLVDAMRMLVAAGNRLNDEAEECTYDDGMAEVASADFWGDFREALETADAALAAHRKQEPSYD